MLEYQFLTNEAVDEQGRSLGQWDGYTPGVPLKLAYRAAVRKPFTGQYPLVICDWLFETFNINHPADYRGRSMSVGDVIQIFGEQDGVHLAFSFAVESIGFKQIDLDIQHFDA